VSLMVRRGWRRGDIQVEHAVTHLARRVTGAYVVSKRLELVFELAGGETAAGSMAGTWGLRVGGSVWGRVVGGVNLDNGDGGVAVGQGV
jgi:hypothetical protein